MQGMSPNLQGYTSMQNNAGMGNCASQKCSPQISAQSCCDAPAANQSCTQMSACGSCSGATNNTQAQSGDPQAVTRAIGIAGTMMMMMMMMMQMFVGNGGIGGMLRQVGWGDTRFHGRAASPFGY
jgi:hypothetical protein